jgi:hypothetical protein
MAAIQPSILASGLHFNRRRLKGISADRWRTVGGRHGVQKTARSLQARRSSQAVADLDRSPGWQFARRFSARQDEAGILLRAESAQWLQGIYIASPMMASYSARSANGQILKRDRLRTGGGSIRVAPPPDPTAGLPPGGGHQ